LNSFLLFSFLLITITRPLFPVPSTIICLSKLAFSKHLHCHQNVRCSHIMILICCNYVNYIYLFYLFYTCLQRTSWLALLLRFREDLGSSLVRKTGYPNWDFSWFFWVLPVKCPLVP
jgi:hypothetical protein